MTRPLLVLRPEPGASATAEAAAAIGLRAIVAPLFTVRALAWDPPAEPPQALLLTSANAVRHAGPGLSALARLPAYAVGEATAEAARAAGFAQVVAGDGGVGAIVALARAAGVARLLHLAGREHSAPPGPPAIEARIVYAADPAAALPAKALAALPDAIALLHSPRAAALFRHLAADAGLPLDRIGIAAISPAAADAAGSGWRALAIAARPTDSALLAAAAKLCDH